VMRLVWRLWIIDPWKNFVFFSPSFSHWMQDFCHQSTSSCALLFASWLFKSVSYDLRSSIKPCDRVCCCSVCICCLRISCAWKMSPKVDLFQDFRCCLRFFSLCWTDTLGSLFVWLPPPTMSLCLFGNPSVSTRIFQI
jgi:hypothetical protein